MHAEIIFDALKTFGLDLKKIKTIFCVLFGNIEGSLQKYHILMLNMSINSYKSLYNLDLIEFKVYSAPACILIPFRNLR